MLPKNSSKERPITLTWILYRVWCRLRKPLLDQWQRALPASMDHDRARPGAQVLQVALERLLRQEVHRANHQHGITCLMDMSTFYDTINLTRLQQEALQLAYPPFRAIHQLLQAWPQDQLPALEQAWTATYHQLQTKDHPWYTVRGPMAATITYLQEWGWQASTLLRWTRQETPFLQAHELSLQQPWWQLERALLQEAKQQRISRIASRPHHQHLLTGIDWHTSLQRSQSRIMHASQYCTSQGTREHRRLLAMNPSSGGDKGIVH